MQRRMQKFLFSFVIAALLMSSSITCYAANTKSLYLLYDIEYRPKYPKGVSETIAKYDAAMRYIMMYRYIDSMADTSGVLSKRITELKDRLDVIQDKLRSAYFLDINEIYALEEEYKVLHSQYAGYVEAMKTMSTKDESNVLDDVPTYKEYCYALELKKLYSGEHNLGAVMIKYPVNKKVDAVSKTKQGILLKVNDATVSSIFNGRVTNVSNHSVTVSHYDGIYTYYGNLHDIDVNVGDSLSQGSPIGKTNGVELRLRIDDKVVDITKVFNED